MNPELQRNLWLEVTPHRLWLIPGVLLGISLLGLPTVVVESLALAGLVVFSMIWGPREAAAAILDEVREHTWDIQRLSSLSPWSMTWGKLFGSTVMSWYGALCCMALYLVVGDPTSLMQRALTAATILFSAITTQGSAMIAALTSMHLGPRANARLSNAVAVALLLALLWYRLDLFNAQTTISWYGIELMRLSFVLGSVISFAAWAVIGAFRAMCVELELRTRPWLWLLFNIYAALYVAGFGFTTIDTLVPPLLSAAGAVACVQAYVAAFAYARDPIEYYRLFHAFSSASWRRALEDMPLWLVSTICALLLGVFTLMTDAGTQTNQRIDNLGPCLLALALMMLRDVMLLNYFSMRRDGHRAITITLVYIAVLDGLLPALFHQLDWSAATILIRPPLFESPFVAASVFAGHAAIATTLAIRSWRRKLRQPSS